MAIKPGDIVGRNSYGCDIYFKVEEIYEKEDKRKWAFLKGLDLRLCADAPLEDLKKVDKSEVSAYWTKVVKKNGECMRRVFMRRSKDRQRSLRRAAELEEPEIEGFDVPGRVLHLDGDKDYLELCMTSYKQLGIPAYGFHVKESMQAEKVKELLPKYRPDQLVLTGHDALIKKYKPDYSSLSSYRNSKYFVEAVREARRYEKSRDDLVIFAGACQSHYEAILEAGANFASSPRRVLIHAYDPVFIMEKIAYTSIYDPISIKDIIQNTITGFDGIGGMETRGKYRLGIPSSPY